MPLRTLRHSLRATAFLYIAAFFVAFGGAGAFIYTTALRGIDREVDLRLTAETLELIQDNPDRPTLVHRIEAREGERHSFGLGYMLLDAANRRIAGSVEMIVPPPGRSDIDHADKVMGVKGFDGGRGLSTKLSNGTTLVLVADSDPMNYSEDLLLRILIIGFLVSGAIVATGMLSLSNMMRTRVGAVRAMAQAIVAGDMTRRLPVTGNGSELDEEARTLNHMLDRISDLLASLKHVSDDVAHDLRTPLMRLRNRLVTTAGRAEAAPIADDLDAALAECDDILDLFAAILRLSEIEAGGRRAAFASVSLHDLVTNLASTFAPVADGAGHSMKIVALDPSEIQGDRVLLAQMLANLIENAIEHTPRGTTVEIDAVRTPDHVALSVSDNGPGIPANAKTSVLQRFTRLDSSRSSRGNGLGLTLVAAIARLHGGTVILGDANPETKQCGLKVSIIFPHPKQQKSVPSQR